MYIAIPELSLFEWHPFSLSSSPEQKIVTLHIRKAGDWTSALYDLATKKMEVSILLEGPYGSVGVDLASDRYKMVMLFSGGIGVTPMQALCNQLMYEQNTGLRELKKLSFVWIERDPNAMKKVDVVRRQAKEPSDVVPVDVDVDVEQGLQTLVRHDSIATILLSMVPPSDITDTKLQEDYASSVIHEDDSHYLSRPVRGQPSQKTSLSYTERGEHFTCRSPSLVRDGQDTVCQSVLDTAYNGRGGGGDDDVDDESHYEVLDLQVYLTARNAPNTPLTTALPFIQYGRPDMDKVFREMRDDALANGERRVAVCVCAPEILVAICQKACLKYSDAMMRFDIHAEVFG